MKKLIFCLPLLAFAFPAAASAAEQTAEKQPQQARLSVEELQGGMKQAFGELMSVMGAVTAGMAEGMKQGAEAMQSELDALDGARVIASSEDLKELASVRVLRSGEKDGKWLITLAVKNEHDTPLRLTDLNRDQQVLLLDEEGFAHKPDAGQERTLTIPARASAKQTFQFSGLEGEPRIFRLYGLDLPVNGAPVSESL